MEVLNALDAHPEVPAPATTRRQLEFAEGVTALTSSPGKKSPAK